MSNNQNPENVKLENVRLSFPALFKPTVFNNEKDKKPKYKATFILDIKKNAADIAKIKAAMTYVLKEKYGDKIPKGFKLALRNGAEKPDIDGYGEGVMFIAASSDKKPRVVERNLDELSEESGKPYAGCFVNATIRMWVMDNGYGKRVNASLRAVQFLEHGEAFGEKPVDPNEEFEALPESESADDII